jgi:hypothetical protein
MEEDVPFGTSFFIFVSSGPDILFTNFNLNIIFQ